MGLRSKGVILVACCWAIACAKAVTEEPDAGSADASVMKDASGDASGCPHPCTGGQVCSNGTCKSSCDSPLVQCASDAGPMCADTTSDKNHCGQCGTVCTTADAGNMAPGYDGGLGWSVGTATCTKSACGITCPGTMSLCSDEICYDTQNHHDHCGDCNTACAASSEWCTQGHCCGVGAVWCSSACVTLATDPNNCGSCGHPCDGGSCSNGSCVACSPATIAGPSLTDNIGGWAKAGLRIQALQNTTLTSFVVNNQGAADVVDLTDTSGTVLQSIALPASNTAYTATVSWALTANTPYDLILEGGANGRWTAYSSFPQSTAGLEVVDTVDSSQTLQPSYWFTFTSLVSCP